MLAQAPWQQPRERPTLLQGPSTFPLTKCPVAFVPTRMRHAITVGCCLIMWATRPMVPSWRVLTKEAVGIRPCCDQRISPSSVAPQWASAKMTTALCHSSFPSNVWRRGWVSSIPCSCNAKIVAEEAHPLVQGGTSPFLPVNRVWFKERKTQAGTHPRQFPHLLSYCPSAPPPSNLADASNLCVCDKP